MRCNEALEHTSTIAAARRRCSPARRSTAQAIINGAGATFPNPIYQKWFSEYNKLHPDVRINYQPVGSGGGIQQVTQAHGVLRRHGRPMTPEQLLAAPGKILHFPTVLGGVVPIYNIPGVTRRAQVHRPAARRHLPRQGHEVERPGDRQGERRRHAAATPTSSSCTARTAPARPTSSRTTWPRCRRSGRARSASTASVNWPTGVGGKGSDGVTGQVRQTPGAIGYVELTYALHQQDRLRRRCRTRPASSSRPRPSR